MRTSRIRGWRTLSAFALLASGLVVSAGDAAAAGPPVFINEIHYDNSGGDTGEAFEIAGPAGTNLTGWTIALYNGSASQLNVYATINLAGTIPNQQAGFGTLTFAQAGIQNGSPDGLALVDAGSAVVEFLSYEGSFTVATGPAAGRTSVDIGVAESSGTPVGDSLQLTGTGTGGGDFSWAASQPNTFGAVNTGQTFSGASGPFVGDLVITEVMQNPSAVFDSAGEWFEVQNVSGSDIDIDGWTISDLGSDTHTISNGGPLVVPAGGFVVLGNNDNTLTNGGATVDYSYGFGWFLSNSADEIVLTDPGSVEFDRIEYDGSPIWPDPTGASMNLDPPFVDVTSNDDGANWCEPTTTFGDGDRGTPGAENDSCDEPLVLSLIHDIQGSGSSVAISGPVMVQGIVTALFERDDVLDGFFVQEEDADADADLTTSEGIFVFCRGGCPGVAPGDLVTVTGSATDFFGMSQIDMAFGSGTAVIDSSGNPLPTASAVALPAASSTLAEATFENVEGMLVSFADTLVVSEYFQLARFGQIVLTESSRPFQYTHDNAPSVGGYAAFLDDLGKRRIILDDDSNDNNDAISDGPDEAFYYPEGGLSLGNKFRGGDTITALTGVMHWSFAGSGGTDAWRVRPIPSEYDYTFTSVNPEPASPADVGGRIQVASFNVLNYFTTIDVTSSNSTGDCGPSGSLDCRGADSAAELTRQRDKIVAAMLELDAEVLGLIELENDGDDSSIADLAAGLNAVAGPGTYDYVPTGFIGDDAIKVGLIFKPAAVSPVGDLAVLDSSVDPTFIDTKNRPVLVQTFVETATSAKFTVAVNHLKSKGSPCDDVGDPGLNDGQANCPGTRAAAATALANYLDTDPTNSGDPDFLIIGDLNAYAMDDAITNLTTAGYTDLVAQFGGADAYSYVFDGQLGYLDHALANGSLLDQVTGLTPWHINADEVNVFDYNDDIRDAGEASFERESGLLSIYAPDPLRSSDHDPVLIGLELDTPRSLKFDTIDELSALLPTGNKNDDKFIQKAIGRVDESLNPAWWTGLANLHPVDGKHVFDGEHQAVQELQKVNTVDVQSAIDQILEADRWLAQRQLDAAILAGGSAKEIARAQGNMADAATHVDNGDYAKAVLDYKKAWQNAVKAL